MRAVVSFRFWRVVVAGAMLLVATSCSEKPTEGSADVTEIVFWHNQTLTNQNALQEIVNRFNALDSKRRVTLEYAGNYSQIYQKIMAAIQAKDLPNIVVSYESMVSEYARANVALPLDEYISNPQHGLTSADLADIFPVFLDTNRYVQFGNRQLSFPFAKSVLMMYDNPSMLEKAGYQNPPWTWDEFIERCRAIKQMTGKQAYALSIDPSTVDAMIFSLGGNIFTPDGTTPLFDQTPAVKAFEIIETLAKEKLCYQVTPGGFDDVTDFAFQRVCFVLRTSASRPFIQQQVQDKFRWDMTTIPQADPAKPVTVLFGPSICILRSTDAENLVAWQFAKFFTSSEITALWATRTGYLPVRKSAAEAPIMKSFFASAPVNRRAFDNLPFARPEPNMIGWQEIRSLIDKAEGSVIAGKQTGRDAALWLNKEASRVIAER